MPARAKKSSKKDKEMSYEDAAEKLESILESIESDDLPLDKLVVHYEEAANLCKICGEKLQSAEKRIFQLERSIEGDLLARQTDLEGEED
ncbi:MAG TPA: exodeoxyribonuclease VII small subunit [Verrucomicrobiales bacterium]|nr:exodeoxyribonuclease VII small subunit [Verrucomicrobiales bacterium]|tara:strand:+ start:354 stop:623 length:270 start_codon:yes stop_codon:yes gene_type:complete